MHTFTNDNSLRRQGLSKRHFSGLANNLSPRHEAHHGPHGRGWAFFVANLRRQLTQRQHPSAMLGLSMRCLGFQVGLGSVGVCSERANSYKQRATMLPTRRMTGDTIVTRCHIGGCTLATEPHTRLFFGLQSV